jgi:hypothetical protein
MGNSPSTPREDDLESFGAYTTKDLPPPYNTIKASDIPQWRWSNRQCRQWLTEVLVEYGNLERDEAERQAQTYQGFGPNLFSYKSETWFKWFGANGSSIPCLIMEMFYAKGACPKNVSFPQAEDNKGNSKTDGEKEKDEDRRTAVDKNS